jgi:hypothetical protein
MASDEKKAKTINSCSRRALFENLRHRAPNHAVVCDELNLLSDTRRASFRKGRKVMIACLASSAGHNLPSGEWHSATADRRGDSRATVAK